MESEIWHIDTRAQWSTLDAVRKKLYSKNVRVGSLEQFAASLRKLDKHTLQQQGVWVTDFGKKYQPIICINAAYRRAVANGATECSCGIGGDEAKVGQKRKNDENERYYKSHDYNAGRHATDTSSHKMNCVKWTPPTCGHLHSWRRGF